ncbi:MAG: trigger factor [Syntrophales bacterium]|nr:trigger factor [Syntrophales bacterium]
MTETNLAVKIEDVSPVKKKLSFEIPWETAKKEMDDVLRKVGKTAKIKGFRQGKIPRPVLELHYKDYIEEETINNLVNRFYWDAVEEHKIVPLSQPKVDQEGIKKENPFSFSATIEVEPVIEPQDYVGLTLEKQKLDVSERDIDLRLGQLQEMYSTMEEVAEERDVKEGDFVVIDFQGSMEGKPHKDMQADNYLLEIGSKSFIPGFEEQIVGMKKNDTKEIMLKFPSDYNRKELADKDVLFKVLLKDLKEKKIPEINEEFVKNFEQYDKLEDLKADIVKAIEVENNEKINSALRAAMVEKLLEKNVFEVPETLVERQIYYMMVDTHRRMSMQGMDPKAAADIIPRMRDMYKEEAVRIVKTLLLMKSIAAKEAITVDKAEIEDYVRDIAKQKAQNYETVRDTYEKEGLLTQVEIDLLNKKVFEFIENKSEISIAEPKQAEAEEEK